MSTVFEDLEAELSSDFDIKYEYTKEELLLPSVLTLPSVITDEDLELAKQEFRTKDLYTKTVDIFSPITDSAVYGMNRWMYANATQIAFKYHDEPVTIEQIGMSHYQWQQTPPKATVAFVWKSLPPDVLNFVFPILVGELPNIGTAVKLERHAVCGIARVVDRTNQIEVSVWDPCGHAHLYATSARLIADAFNRVPDGPVSRGYTFVPKTSWDDNERLRTMMICGPQVNSFYKNDYCTVFAYLKAKDLVENGYPGKLLTSDDWESVYNGKNLDTIGRISVTLRFKTNADQRSINHDDPPSQDTIWWLCREYGKLKATQTKKMDVLIGTPEDRRDFDRDDERKCRPISFAKDGGRSVTVRRSIKLKRHIDEDDYRLPHILKTDKNAVTLLMTHMDTEDAESFQDKVMFTEPLEDFNNDALLAYLMFPDPYSDELTLHVIRIRVSEAIKHQSRRVEFIRAVLKAASTTKTWTVDTVIEFWEKFCSQYWRNEKYPEFKLLERPAFEEFFPDALSRISSVDADKQLTKRSKYETAFLDFAL